MHLFWICNFDMCYFLECIQVACFVLEVDAGFVDREIHLNSHHLESQLDSGFMGETGYNFPQPIFWVEV